MCANIRARESLFVLGLFSRSLLRHRYQRTETGATIIHLPEVGRLLFTEGAEKLWIEVIAVDERGAQAMIDAVAGELRHAVQGHDFESSFSVNWTRVAIIPAALR